MEFKDLIATALAALALLVSIVSLRRSRLTGEESATLSFEQKRQELLQLLWQLDLAQKTRSGELSLLVVMTRGTELEGKVAEYEMKMPDTSAGVSEIRTQLKDLRPEGRSEELVGLERILGVVKQQKQLSDQLDADLTELVSAIRTLLSGGQAA